MLAAISRLIITDNLTVPPKSITPPIERRLRPRSILSLIYKR